MWRAIDLLSGLRLTRSSLGAAATYEAGIDHKPPCLRGRPVDMCRRDCVLGMTLRFSGRCDDCVSQPCGTGAWLRNFRSRPLTALPGERPSSPQSASAASAEVCLGGVGEVPPRCLLRGLFCSPSAWPLSMAQARYLTRSPDVLRTDAGVRGVQGGGDRSALSPRPEHHCPSGGT